MLKGAFRVPSPFRFGFHGPIFVLVRGDEFIKRVMKLGRARGIPVVFDAKHGKGSHGMLHYGRRRTVVKDRKKDLRPGLLHAMLAQLGLTKRDLEG